MLDSVLFHTDPLDDVLSFWITIGSPALAAYSLQITHLNKRWITTAFSDVKYPNSKHISTVLSAFQHVPIRVSHHPPLLHSLIILPKNDDFWYYLAMAVEKTPRWSIPLIINFVLVILSVILTVLDSYIQGPSSSGPGMVATWVFLLPLIIGWLRVGCEPEPNHLRNSLDAASLGAWVATGQGDQPVGDTLAMEFVEDEDVDFARKDELKTGPLFNYSRAFTSAVAAELTLELMRNAAANAERRIPVGTSRDGVAGVWVESEGDAISDENRTGTDSEVTEYCTRVLPRRKSNPAPTALLDIEPSETSIIPDPSNSTSAAQYSEVLDTLYPPLPLYNPHLVIHNPSIWATGIRKRVALAAILALGLQWGTSGVAVVINYSAPPYGLGCRALSHLLYCMTATTSFLLFLASSILAHMSRPHKRQNSSRSPRLHACINMGAIVCRRLGKLVAIVSAAGTLVACFLEITGAFDNCFCRSTTFDKGRDFVSYAAKTTSSFARVWITGMVMAFSTAFLFGLSIYLSTPLRR